MDSCSVRHQGNCCASTCEIPAIWISIRTQGTERCSCNKTASLARHKHTWISPRAQRDMFRRKDCGVLTLRAHLDLFPCANRHAPCDSTAAFARCEHTWISPRAQRDMLKECCILTPRAHSEFSPCANKHAPCDNTAAFARCEHTWISLCAQRDMFRRKDCCVLTQRAHLDLSPCASKKTCSSDGLLRSHAITGTLGSLSVRKETGKTTFSRREHTWRSPRAQKDMFHRKDCCDLALPPKVDNFYLRTPDPVSTVKRAHVPYAIGNP